MNNASNGPMLKAAGLWAKSSVKGGQYLTGRLGGVKVLILENRERHSDDDPSHILYFTEAPDRRQGAGERPQERSGGGESTPDQPEGITASAQRRCGLWKAGTRSSGAARPRWSAAGQGCPRRRAGVGTMTAFSARGLNSTSIQLNGTECVAINGSECNSYYSDCLKSVGNPNYPDALKAPSAIKDDY